MDTDFIDRAVTHREAFARHIFLAVLPTWFARLGAEYPEKVTVESLAAFREHAEGVWADALSAYAKAKRPWGRALDELYKLEAAKQPNKERIAAKEAEVDALRVPKDEAFAVLMDARRLDESARKLDSAWEGLGWGETDGFRWLLISLSRVASYSPELRVLADVIRGIRLG